MARRKYKQRTIANETSYEQHGGSAWVLLPIFLAAFIVASIVKILS